MRNLLVLCFLAACAHTSPLVASPPPAADHSAMTVELFRATDSFDLAALEPLVAAEFDSIYVGRHTSRERLLKRLGAGKEKGYPRISERRWEDVRVRVTGHTAVVTGYTRYTMTTRADAEPYQAERYMTVVWVVKDGRWQALHVDAADAGPDAERQAWNEVYRAPAGFNLEPNQLLVDTVKGRQPGRALDVSMGQGRNTLFLAAAGWQVTGVDISDVGVSSARQAAAERGLAFESVISDIALFDWGQERWDLICFIYAGGRQEVAQVRRSLKKGGIVVIEFFMRESMKDVGLSGFDPGELPRLYGEGFKVLRYDEVEARPDWGPPQAKLVRFVAEKL